MKVGDLVRFRRGGRWYYGEVERQDAERVVLRSRQHWSAHVLAKEEIKRMRARGDFEIRPQGVDSPARP